MLDPGDLYTVTPGLPEPDGYGRPVLVQALSGFVDAGNGAHLAREHLLSAFEHEVVATFDHDQLHDYRARRPVMVFDENHWQSYDEPRLALLRLRDVDGTPFLLLTGPEPDTQWERFIAAVSQLVERFDVRLTVGLDAIPMAVPHTRPVGVTAHGTRADLVRGHEPWVQRVQVPASVGALLEYRLGQAGRDAMGFAVHVPHYLVQMDYPGAAAALLDALAAAAELSIPTGALTAAAEHTRSEIDAQVDESSEVRSVVEGLERQYDAYVSARSQGGLLAQPSDMPSADELGAELERFLAQQTRRGDEPES
ncbi:MAG: proteasome assembly chaperone family protein [Actinomycetes bacterium]